MAANTTPIFTLTPHIGSVSATVANTSLTAPGGGTVYTVFTAGTNGSSLEQVRVKSLGTSTAGMIRLFLYDGTTYWFVHEIPVTAIVASGTVASWFADWQPPNTLWNLPTGWSLRATIHNADAGYVVTAIGGDY